MAEREGREPQYDALADGVFAHASDGFFNAHCDRSACLASLGEVWSHGWRVRYRVAPLERTCAELYSAGFLIERLWESRPLATGTCIEPGEYERLQRELRGVLAIRAVARA